MKRVAIIFKAYSKIYLIDFLFLLIILRFQYFQSKKHTWYCHLVEHFKVVDGDSADIKVLEQNWSVRFLYIDAPEWDQLNEQKNVFIGEQATLFLKKSIELSASIYLLWQQRDRYGRILGEFYHGGKSLNLLMVEAGHAWLYPYSRYRRVEQKRLYLNALNHARIKKMGIWKDHKVTSPWRYRRLKKQKI